jgi:hypothetical protein
MQLRKKVLISEYFKSCFRLHNFGTISIFHANLVAHGSTSGNISGPSRKVFQQFSNRQARSQQLNHLIRIDSYLRAQRDNLSDRALQRFFLLRSKRLGWILD